MKRHLLTVVVLLALIAGLTSVLRAPTPTPTTRPVGPVEAEPVMTIRGVRLGMTESEVDLTLGCQPFRSFPSKDPNRYSRTWGSAQAWQLGSTFTNGQLTDMGGFGSDFTIGARTFRYKSDLASLLEGLGPADPPRHGHEPRRDSGWMQYSRWNLEVSYADGKVTGMHTWARPHHN